MKIRDWLAGASALALLTVGAAQPALAQEADEAPVVEEIVVTAQKREQSFNDVGIAITAIGERDLREMRMQNVVDIAAQMPNVKIHNVMANSIPNISIRGIGLNDYATNNNPAAGVYVDEVYLVSPAMLSFQMIDIARVEVLRGPQGTLYGRNTTAGAVNFIANKPSEEFDAGISFDYGSYERVEADGYVTGALAPTLQGRAAVQKIRQYDGYQKNRLNGDHVGEIDTLAWRTMLAWQPAETVDVMLNLHGGQDDSDIDLIKIDNPFTPEDDGDDDPFRSGASVDTEQDIDSTGASLKVDWELGGDWTLTSVTGWEQLDRIHVEDRDGSSLEQLDGDFDNSIEQGSQELRLAYVTDARVFMVGAYYSEDEVETRDRFDASDLLPLFGLPGMDAIGNEYRQTTDSAALFVHTEWQLASDWRTNFGVRYIDEQKDFEDAYTFLMAAGTEIPVFPAVGNDYEVDEFSGKLGIDFTGIEDVLLYASVSKGFKSGGFQGQLAFDPANLGGFDEETLWAYEVGAKSTLLDGSLQLNASAFFYDYQDMQFYGGLFDSPVGTLFGIANVGDAEVTGAELELAWRPAAGLDVRLGLGLLDTEVTKSIVAGVADGSELPNAPEVTANGSVRYEWDLGNGLSADALLDFSYQDEVAFDIVRAPQEAQEDSYWLANARLGVRGADGRWGVHLWGHNLADEEYRTQVIYSSVGFGESWGMPRTWGIGAEYTF